MSRRWLWLMGVVCALLVCLGGCGKQTGDGGQEVGLLMQSRSYADGITLSVFSNVDTYGMNEDISLSVSVRNGTGRDIALFMPVVGEDTHTEIQVELQDDQGFRLVDKDTYGRAFDTAVSCKGLAAGETYEQTMTFATRWVDEEGREQTAPAGVYQGTATVQLLNDPADVSGSTTPYTLEFTLTIKG